MYWPLSSVWAVALRTGFRAIPLEMERDWSAIIPDPIFDQLLIWKIKESLFLVSQDLLSLQGTGSFDLIP